MVQLPSDALVMTFIEMMTSIKEAERPSEEMISMTRDLCAAAETLPSDQEKVDFWVNIIRELEDLRIATMLLRTSVLSETNIDNIKYMMAGFLSDIRYVSLLRNYAQFIDEKLDADFGFY